MKTFNVGQIKAAIAAVDTKLAELFELCHYGAIDCGTHPNPLGTFSAMKMEQVLGRAAIGEHLVKTPSQAARFSSAGFRCLGSSSEIRLGR